MSNQEVLIDIVEKLNRLELRQVLSSKKFLSLHELSIYLDVKMETVYALNKKRVFTRYKPTGSDGRMVYVMREEVDNWIENSDKHGGVIIRRLEDITTEVTKRAEKMGIAA